MEDIFYPDGDAAHERYGFGKMAIGEVVAVDLNGESAKTVQIHVHSHGQHYGKKFKTKTRNGSLYVKRIS
jgi:hypothetical protein